MDQAHTDPDSEPLPLQRPGWLASSLYNLLVRTAWWWQYPVLSRVWERSWRKYQQKTKRPVTTRIHGYRTTVGPHYTYPVYSRRYPHLNDPLVELVYHAYRFKDGPIGFVDVGAAIGDTVLLVKSNCPNMIGRFYCIDGDREFFSYLRENLRDVQGGQLILSVLSASSAPVPDLVRIHGGTASAQGEKFVPSSTLDNVLRAAGLRTLEVLKIDVDGFDGQVLAGGVETLLTHRPAVIFEWHPGLCNQTANRTEEHFEVLDACGYDRYLWFTKYGEFSHFMQPFNHYSVAMLAEFCTSTKTFPDWHYDVIALHESSQLSPVRLADCAYARQRTSRF